MDSDNGNNNWLELKIGIPASNVETASAIANMVVPYGIYIEDYSSLEAETLEIAHIDLIDAELLNKDREKAYIHIYIHEEENPQEAAAFLEERFRSEGIPYDIEMSGCKQEDWINNWKKYFKPIPVGTRLLIRPVWEAEVDSEDRIVLDLEPGIAFGTGTHETTRLCMELLETYTIPGGKVLDVGCGSGILSIAALLLGSSQAVGVDIDRLAVKTARENARMNHVEAGFTGICGNLTDKVTGQFDVILANIVADVIIDLLKDIRRFMKPDTVFIVSGIISSREGDVLVHLDEHFEIIARKEERDWVAMALRMKHLD